MCKKVFSLVLCLSIVLGLAACGSSAESSAESVSELPESEEESSTESSELENPSETEAILEDTEDASEEESEEEIPVEPEPSVEETASSEEELEPVEESNDYVYGGEWAEYPLCEIGSETLTMWCEFPGFLGMIGIESYSDFTTFAAAEEATGVHIEFVEVSQTAKSELFSLMCASGDYNDLLSGAISIYGSVSSAIEDEVVLDLAEYAESYMGNYMTILNDPANKSAKQLAYNSEGQLGSIESLSDDYCPTTGAQIRQDWLDELGLDTPVTYADWEETLLAFKDAYGCTSAMLLSGMTQSDNGMLVGGYGTIGSAETYNGSAAINMYVDDGEIRNGYVDDAYKDYLSMLARWYSEGLLSPDFITGSTDNSENDSESWILSGNAGIWYAQGNFIGTYEEQGGEGFKISGLAEPYDPEYTDGINHFGADVGSDASGTGISVSTGCSNPVLACQWLDYFFSEDGILLANYGIEGEGFEYDENGEPQFSDFLLNSDNFQFYMTGYTLSAVPTYQDFDKTWFTYGDNVIEAFEIWDACTDSTMSIPTAVTLNADQSEQYSTLFSDIQTMATEYVDKFVVGEYNIDEQWDEYVETLYMMGLQNCIDIYQEAYDDFMASLN